MSRIYTCIHSKENPKINYELTKKFFRERANKIEELGSVQAVIYQDNNPELAKKRNISEKNKLLSLLDLNNKPRILDVGCGTGRWAETLISKCNWYHGIDSCEEFIQYSLNKFKKNKNARFTAALANSFTLNSLGEEKCFDRVLCAGVLIYLNDNEVNGALNCMSKVLNQNGLLILREPMGVGKRLTILDSYSSEMNQNYSAIYRTLDEIINFINHTELKKHLQLIDHGNVYDDSSLNNRSDTQQKWLILKKL